MSLVNGINKLKSLGLNTAEDILQIPVVSEEDQKQRAVYNRIIEHCDYILGKKDTNVIVRPNGSGGLLPTEITSADFVEYHKQVNFSHELLVFKAPRHRAILWGHCIPNHNFNEFEFAGHRMPYFVYWGQQIDMGCRLMGQPYIQEIVGKVNSLLSPKKFELADQRVEFTVHERGVGMIGGLICFWGIYE